MKNHISKEAKAQAKVYIAEFNEKERVIDLDGKKTDAGVHK